LSTHFPRLLPVKSYPDLAKQLSRCDQLREEIGIVVHENIKKHSGR